jgi:hypothetical protein
MIKETKQLTGRRIAQKTRDMNEEMVAHMNRRIINSLREEGAGRRRIKVGA